MASQFKSFGNNKVGYFKVNKNKTLGDVENQLARINRMGGDRAARITRIFKAKKNAYRIRVADQDYDRKNRKAWEQGSRATSKDVYMAKQTSKRAWRRRRNEKITQASRRMSGMVAG